MNIVHESDIHDALATIGICEVDSKEYLFVWYDENDEHERMYVYVELDNRAILKRLDMYTIYMSADEWYNGTWNEMNRIHNIVSDMLPMPGEYYNDSGEPNCT